MVQVAISSPAYFADPSKAWFDPKNLAPDEYADPEPWELPETAPPLNKEIVNLVSQSSKHAEIYADMVAFTRLQRFFRNALDGAMSESFPLAELPKIAAATLPAVNAKAPTLRWHVRPGQVETMMKKLLAEASSADNPSPGVATRACLGLARRNDAAGIRPEQWHAACGTEILSEEHSKETVGRITYLNKLRDLRFDLELPRDEALAARYYASGCPRP